MEFKNIICSIFGHNKIMKDWYPTDTITTISCKRCNKIISQYCNPDYYIIPHDDNLIWTIIEKGTILPDDFIINGNLNRHKYIIQYSLINQNQWIDDTLSFATVESIAIILIGGNHYNDFRYRLRNDHDEKLDLKNNN